MNRKVYTVEDDYAPILKGEIDIPNQEPADPIKFLSNLAALGHCWKPFWGYGKGVPGRDRKTWTQFFLTCEGTMGQLSGTGYAVVYNYDNPIVLRFAICKHEKVEGAGANHERGWHPGSCKKCGLDMTVDSGD